MEKSIFPQNPLVSLPTYPLALDAAAAEQVPITRLSMLALIEPTLVIVMVVVSGVPDGTWVNVPTSLLMAQLALLAELTDPPLPDPVE
jgi:EamA domain-containing membrane protein RarD